MKTLISILSLAIVFLSACSSGKTVSSSAPVQKAKDYNYNYNQAKSIVNYTSGHKKARQKIADHNRETQNENLNKLNATNKTPDTRNKGQFRFYRNN